MRLIVVGCEYVGKSALIDGLSEWGKKRGIIYHMDDHFTIPEQFNLKDPAEQEEMVAMSPKVKERYQRFQIDYHVLTVLTKFEDCLLGGFHIEEMIYGPRYYHPGMAGRQDYRELEHYMPPDCILLLLTASPDVIKRRMKSAPHPYPLVMPEEVEAVSQEFASEFGRPSALCRKFTIDTSKLTPAQLLDSFLERVVPYLDTRDLLRWQMLR